MKQDIVKKASKTRKQGMDIDQEYELVPIDQLQVHPDNPKRGAVLEIEVSIDRNGWYGVVTAQKSTGYILAGNHRFLAAKNHGAQEVPTIWLDVDDERAKRIMLADNRTADLGSYDEEKLDDLLKSLPSIEGTGYEDVLDRADAKEKAKAEKDDEIPDDKHTPTYGIHIVCESEEDQEQLYNSLKHPRSKYKDRELRVVAV